MPDKMTPSHRVVCLELTSQDFFDDEDDAEWEEFIRGPGADTAAAPAAEPGWLPSREGGGPGLRAAQG